MSGAYLLSVTNAETKDFVTYVAGDLDIIAYAVRKFPAETVDATFSATFTETQGINGDDVRTVLSITGDLEVVELLLKKKIRSERVRVAASAVPSLIEPSQD